MVIPDDLVELGRIVSAYGVRGMVKIQPHSAQESILLNVKEWWLARLSRAGVQQEPHRLAKVSRAREHTGSIVAFLEGCDDRDQAEALKGTSIFVSRAIFPTASDDEYYWVDLIGCSVYSTASASGPVLLGLVQEVSDNGAHAVLHIARQELDEQGDVVFLKDDKGRVLEVLVPFVQAHVPFVDIRQKRIETDWPADF
ncbi:ribosome maturation factor RimM [Advenella sp. WQ 585]|uniref:Ribosome maturation factor RimM n=1 Tax=Advenella mandrilli TaxID=2800330 RepID=A0ABS1EFQ6_9BURK|nr:ribosome maturation factor RimM [Advenella mandrilli]MBK1781122.1 ribosome maturation factor RimM [Advenella mandrilli]